MHYPEINALIITTNLIMESHLPGKNMEGIAGSTETLLRKCELLNQASIPPELFEQKDEILERVDGFRKVIMMMQECCKNENMDDYKKHVETLSTQLMQFVEEYI